MDHLLTANLGIVRSDNNRFVVPLYKGHPASKPVPVIPLKLDRQARSGLPIKNPNVLVIGGVAAGKTYRYIEPNILNETNSLVIFDPYCDIMIKTGKALEKKGYRIRVFNPSFKSNFYNPFFYFDKARSVYEDIPEFVDVFWKTSQLSEVDEVAKFLLQTIMFYVFFNEPVATRHLNTVSELVCLLGNEQGITVLDKKFHRFAKAYPSSIVNYLWTHCRSSRYFESACKALVDQIYKRFPHPDFVPGQPHPDFFPWDGHAITKDTMNLPKITAQHFGDKTAIFIQTPSELSYLAVTMICQIIRLAKNYYGSQDPQLYKWGTPIRFYLDEFANLGIPDSYVRDFIWFPHYNMSVSAIVQAVEQLKMLYPHIPELINDWGVVAYFGGARGDTTEYISSLIGVRENDPPKVRRGRPRKAKPAMILTPQDLQFMEHNKALVLLRNNGGLMAFIDEKVPGVSYSAK